MRLIYFSFLIFFIVHCAGTDKKSSSEQMNRSFISQGIIDQARYLSQEVLSEGKENVDFLLKKLEIASRKYKELQKQLAVLEGRVQQLVRRMQNREDVEIAVEEDGETALMEDKPTLFEDEEVDNPFLSQKAKELPVQNADKKTTKDEKVSENTKEKKKESASAKKLFIRGQKLFIDQSWEKAIEVLEEYRNKHPEGAQYPSATYLIGRAFQELDMKEEAQIFFKELVAGYPNSSFAKKAQKLIK